MGLLRIILALFVVIDHSRAIEFINFPDGPFAVKVFFIISGFYMTMILKKKYVGEGSYGLFISNRFLRLFPIYWVVLGLTIIFSFTSFFIFNDWMRLTSSVVYNEFMSLPTIAFLGITNLMLVGQDIVFFLGLNIEKGSMFFTNDFHITHPQFHDFLFLPQAWTISLEILFYLIAPFIVRKRLPVIFGFIVISILIRCFIYFGLNLHHDPWTYRFFPNELALFLIGTFSYHIYNYFQKKSIKLLNHWIVLIIYFLLLFTYNYLPDFNISIDIKSVLFYLLTGLSIPSIFLLTKSYKIDNRIGDLSYPIYLVHMLILYIMNTIIVRTELNIPRGTFVIIITIISSYILVKFVADPIEKIRHRRVIK